MQAKKALVVPNQATAERTSQVQMSLKYAQEVAATVKARRRAALEQRLEELFALPVSHPADVSLRDDLARELRAQLKQLDKE